MIGIGLYCRKHATDVSGFVLGGRSVGPWLTAFAYGTSYFSAVIFIGYAGQFGWKFGIASTWIRIGNAIIGSMLICEMAAYYKSQGKTLIDVMNGLYDEFGYYCNTVQSYTFEGAAGMEKMAAIMDGLRDNKPSSFAGYEVTKIDD